MFYKKIHIETIECEIISTHTRRLLIFNGIIDSVCVSNYLSLFLLLPLGAWGIRETLRFISVF
jgi:hypothetical protein